MMKACHRDYCAPILVSMAIILIVATFVSTGAESSPLFRPPALHGEPRAVTPKIGSLLGEQGAENTITTTSTSTTTTTSTKTSSTTVTTTTITITTWTRTTTTTEFSLTTTTRTTGMTYTSTSLSPTMTAPTTVAIIWIYSTTTTTTTTVTEIGTTQLLATTSAKTTITITATPGTRRCIIASAAHESELAPDLQFLRELRDETILRSFAGKHFMKAFDEFYYSFSPRAAEILEKASFLRSLARILISPLIASLRIAAAAVTPLSSNSESTNVLFGMIASALTGTIYFSPILILSKIALRFRSRSASAELKKED